MFRSMTPHWHCVFRFQTDSAMYGPDKGQSWPLIFPALTSLKSVILLSSQTRDRNTYICPSKLTDLEPRKACGIVCGVSSSSCGDILWTFCKFSSPAALDPHHSRLLGQSVTISQRICIACRHVPWQKIKVQDPEGPASSIHFRILGSQVPRQIYISGSWVPKVPCQVYISGSWVSRVPRPVYISGSRVPKVPRQVHKSGSWVPKVHDKYKFQDPESQGSYIIEFPRSHKYTVQDPESPRSHDK